MSKKRLVTLPRVAAGAEGYAVAAWLQGRVAEFDPDGQSSPSRAVLRVAVREAGAERFGVPVSVSGRGVGGYRLAAADSGETALAWGQQDGVRVRIRQADGGWEAEQTVGGPGSGLMSMAMGREGMLVLTYVEDWVLKAVTRLPGGILGPPQPLATLDRGGSWTTASAAGGQAMVAWGQGCREDGPRAPIKVSLLNGIGLFGPRQEVAGSACPTSGLRSAIAPSGEATLLVNGDCPGAPCVRISTRRSGEQFAQAVAVRPPRRKLDQGDLGATANGHTTVIWGRATGFGPIAAMSRPPAGDYRPHVRVAGRKATLQAFAVGGEGTAVVITRRRHGTEVKPKLYAAHREGAKGAFGPAEVVARHLSRHALGASHVAVGADGHATVIWSLPRPRHVEERAIVVRSHP